MKSRKMKPVTEKLRSLRKQASDIGCVLVIQSHPIQPHTTVTVIPDNEYSKQRCEFGVSDGAVLVNVDDKDMDKKAKNSRYYKKLVELEERLHNRREAMRDLASKLKGRDALPSKPQESIKLSELGAYLRS